MSGSSFIAAMFPAIGATWQRPQVAVKDMFRIRGYPMLEGSLWPEGSDRNRPAEKDGRVMELWSWRPQTERSCFIQVQKTHLSFYRGSHDGGEWNEWNEWNAGASVFFDDNGHSHSH